VVSRCRHLWRAAVAAATVVVLVAGACTVAAARTRPALATGTYRGHLVGLTTDHREVTRWRLEGARLTMTVEKPLLPHRSRLRVEARCGENAASDMKADPETQRPAWADLARGHTRVSGAARTVRVRLDRDIANRVSLCTLVIAPVVCV